MDYTEIIYLISHEREEDDIGNIISSSISSKKIYAKKQSVKTNEFYNAIQVGMTPSIEFIVKRLNYDSEEELIWNKEKYSIIRTVDPKNKLDIVLVCGKKTGI